VVYINIKGARQVLLSPPSWPTNGQSSSSNISNTALQAAPERKDYQCYAFLPFSPRHCWCPLRLLWQVDLPSLTPAAILKTGPRRWFASDMFVTLLLRKSSTDHSSTSTPLLNWTEITSPLMWLPKLFFQRGRSTWQQHRGVCLQI